MCDQCKSIINYSIISNKIFRFLKVKSMVVFYIISESTPAKKSLLLNSDILYKNMKVDYCKWFVFKKICKYWRREQKLLIFNVYNWLFSKTNLRSLISIGKNVFSVNPLSAVCKTSNLSFKLWSVSLNNVLSVRAI